MLGNLLEAHVPGSPSSPTCTNSSGCTFSYIPDPLGRRVVRLKDGVTTARYVYLDQLRIGAEYDGSGNLRARYIYGSKPNVPEMMVRGGALYRLVTDERGSLRLVVRVSDGQVMQRTDYDAWGNVTAEYVGGWADGEPVPFGFAGGLFDRGTGLVRFGARDYDPQLGRWTNKDPSLFDGGANLYGYGGGDPVNFVDTTGRNPVAVAAVAGAALGIAGELVAAEQAHRPTTWQRVVFAGGFGAVTGALGAYPSGFLVSVGVNGALGALFSVASAALDDACRGQSERSDLAEIAGKGFAAGAVGAAVGYGLGYGAARIAGPWSNAGAFLPATALMKSTDSPVTAARFGASVGNAGGIGVAWYLGL